MPELVFYGIRELAPAIPRTTPRHRGGKLWSQSHSQSELTTRTIRFLISPFLLFLFVPGWAQCFVINFNFVPDNLEEDSKYEARVEARNGFGWSNQSDVFKFFTRTKGLWYFRNKREYQKFIKLSFYFQKLQSSSPLSLRRLRLPLNLATFIIFQEQLDLRPATSPGSCWARFCWWFFVWRRNGFNQNCQCKKRWNSC